MMDAFDQLVAEAIALKAKGKKRARAAGPAKESPATPSYTSATSAPTAPGEVATALCTIIQRQHCSCCGGTSESVGGQYVILRNERQRATRHLGVSAASLPLTQEELSALPFRVDYVERSVAFCPACLQLGLNTEYLLAHADAERWNVQLNLWRQ